MVEPLFSLTPLGTVFLALLALGVVPNLLYVVGYWPHLLRKGHFALFYAGFVLAMAGVVFANTPLSFLFSWEMMSLTSWQLILNDARSEKTRSAARFYFLMTHLGFASLLLFFLLATGGHLSVAFDQVNFQSWNSATRWGLFALLAFGTLSKAGVVPMHVWLPYAHPAAPSPVSALMSGVMLKIALFALFAFLLRWFQPWPLAWGMIVLVLGAVSALIGVLYALVEHDLKALLANHSIENIGIILLAAGMAMIFSSLQLPTLAAFAWAAALFHTFNHMAFKSLLFMGAGSILHQTHTGHIEHYGGLIKTMPITALTFLFAAVSISALPPTNGFLSEWMVFQSMMGSTHFSDMGLRLLVPFAIFSLALTGGLAIACFVKAFGISFLGLHRSENARHAHEVNRLMQLGMISMAAVVASLMFVAPWYLQHFTAVLSHYGYPNIAHQLLSADGQIRSVSDNGGRVSPVWLLLLLSGVVLVIWWASRWLGIQTRLCHTWACGGETTARNQYTATGFAGSIRVFFGWLYRPEERVHRQAHTAFDHHLSKFAQAKHHLHVMPLFESSLYQGVVRLLRILSYWVYRMVHFESLRYSGMILGVLILMLLTYRLGVS